MYDPPPLLPLPSSPALPALPLPPHTTPHTTYTKNLNNPTQIRILYSLLTHILARRPPTPLSAPTLFHPIITRSRCSLLELDYNIHKSNSTYFSDLDVARMHLVASLMRLGLDKAYTALKAERRGVSTAIALGGVTCTFRREIRPLEAYEIWTRVLAWDRKWLYLASWVVKNGTVRAGERVLQPGRRGRTEQETKTEEAEEEEEKTKKDGHPPVVFATSIAKYVFKQGRLTIPPETLLQAANLIPSPPPSAADHQPPPPPASETPPLPDRSSIGLPIAAALQDLSDVVTATARIDAALQPEGMARCVPWTWRRVEEERLRGMEVAKAMAGLDALMDAGWGPGEGDVVLGCY